MEWGLKVLVVVPFWLFKSPLVESAFEPAIKLASVSKGGDDREVNDCATVVLKLADISELLLRLRVGHNSPKKTINYAKGESSLHSSDFDSGER